MQIERVASDNLREYSQSTQYIFDWSSHPPESQNTFKQHTALA